MIESSVLFHLDVSRKPKRVIRTVPIPLTFMEPAEFGQLADICYASLPISVSFSETLDVLERVTQVLLNAKLELDLVLVRLPMPCWSKFPVGLLDPRILLVQDANNLDAFGDLKLRVVLIDCRVVHHTLFPGDNAVLIRFIDFRVADEALSAISDVMSAEGYDCAR